MATDQPDQSPELQITGETDPLLRARLFGRLLQNTRREHGETLKQVSARAGVSAPTLSRIENGQPVASVMAPGLLEAYEVAESLHAYARTLTQVRESDGPPWWHEFKSVIPQGLEELLRLELYVTRIKSLSTSTVEGLLQTHDYATSINERTSRPSEDAALLARRVELRMARQRIFDRGVELAVLLDEGVLHRVVGSRRVMREQVEHLLRLTERRTVDLRVLPCDAGAYPGMLGHTLIMEAPGQRIVYSENSTGNSYLSASADVVVIEQMFDRATESALAPGPTREFLQAVVETYGV